jgi:hypothetical protein
LVLGLFMVATVVNAATEASDNTPSGQEAVTAGMPSPQQTGAPSACHLEGRRLLDKGETQAAADQFDQCVKQDPRDWRSWAGLGGALSKLGDKPGAIAAYGQSLALNPADADIARALADLKAVSEAVPGEAAATAAPGTARPAPVTPGDFREYRWWAKVGPGGGSARQGGFEDIADAFAASFTASGYSTETELGDFCLGVGGEVGRRIDQHLGVCAAFDLLWPGNLTTTAQDSSGWWLTQKLSQTAVDLRLNVLGFLPVGRARAWAQAGGGPVFAWLTHDVDIHRTVISENTTFGLGYCALGELGLQWPLGSRHSLDVGVKALWVKVPKYSGTYTDAEGEHRGEMLVDADGFIYAGAQGEAPPEGGKRLSSEFLDIGLNVSLAYYFL